MIFNFGGSEKMAEISVQKLSELEGNHRLDAEFYQPRYLIDFSKGNWQPIKKFLAICQYGISQAMTEEPRGHPIFRMDDIKNCFLLDGEVKYIETTQQIFDQFKLETNDILFNRVNAEEFVGRTGIFKLRGDYVFASYLIRLRIKHKSEILPDYLNIFLNTKFGKKQIRRFSRRAVNQANVNAEELKNFKIAIIPMKIQKRIQQLSDDAWDNIGLAKSLYLKAENLLLEKLGLLEFKPSYRVSYNATLSRAFATHRLDAEYFQPMYDELIARVIEAGYYTVKQIQGFNRRGVQPNYVEDGEINVVTSKRLGRISIDYENLEITSLDEWKKNSDARIKFSDILIYTTGAYVGITNCFLENCKALASNHVNILRIKKLNPAYVAVFLNSIVGQMQVKRIVSGSAQVELYPDDISRFVIWKAPKKIQERIALLVQQSYEARKKANELLGEAIRKVEGTIDKQIN